MNFGGAGGGANQEQMMHALQELQKDPHAMQMLQQEAQQIQTRAATRSIISAMHKKCFMAHALGEVSGDSVRKRKDNLSSKCDEAMKKCIKDKIHVEEKVREIYQEVMGEKKKGFRGNMSVPAGTNNYIR